MRIRFNVDRVAATKSKVNTTAGIVTLDMDPATMTDQDAERLAERLAEISTDDKRNGADPQVMNVRSRSKEGGCYSNVLVTALSPTLEALMVAIHEEDAAVQTYAQEREKEAQAHRQQKHKETQAVLTARKTTSNYEFWYGHLVDGKIVVDQHNYTSTKKATRSVKTMSRDWPCDSDQAIIDSPESQAWAETLKQQNAMHEAETKALLYADVEAVKTKEEAQAQIEAQAQAKAEAWINVHGSPRLMRMVKESYEYRATYRDERLALERPDWEWLDETSDLNEPRNPSQAALDLFDHAKITAPDCELFYATREHNHGEDCYGGQDDCPKYECAGYVVVADFLGKRIMLSGSHGPADDE